MAAFYEQEAPPEEDPGRAGGADDDLDFDYLFEYEPPAGDTRGLSAAFLSLLRRLSLFCPEPGRHRSYHGYQKLDLITDGNEEVVLHVVAAVRF